MMEIITLTYSAAPKETQGDPQIRIPNFRRQLYQIKQIETRNRVDKQQIRPPFQENYVEEERETTNEPDQNQINIFGEGEI